jgi:hypothetical protein
MTPRFSHIQQWLALLLLAYLGHTKAARLLIVPLASESHIAAFTALSTDLETLGVHEVYMVGNSTCRTTPAAAAAAAASAFWSVCLHNTRSTVAGHILCIRLLMLL